MEKVPKISETKKSDGSLEAITSYERRRMKEEIFENIIETRVLKTFLDGLSEAGYPEEDINQIQKHLLEQDDNMIKSLVAFPYELKKRVLPYMLEKSLKDGTNPSEELIALLHKRHEMNGTDIAYHASPHDIRPTRESDGGSGYAETWMVRGTEKDHRNEDLPMAYYSKDYTHLYRTKNPKYLYLIEISKKTGSHKKDGVEWGRAMRLDIIDKLDLRELDAQVDAAYQEIVNQKKEPAEKKAA